MIKNNNFKVAHLTTVHPKNDNRIFYKECRTLKESGFDILLVVAGEEDEIIDGIQIVGFKKHNSRLRRIFKTSFFDLIKVCKKLDADIYHFHDPEILFAGLYLKLIGKKVIYDIHENNPAAIMSKSYIKSLFYKKIIASIFNVVEQIASKYFDALVTARPDISKRFNHENLITLRNFPILPDLSKLEHLDMKKEKPIVIFIGGMTNLRGINQLIDAFEELDDYELCLLGPIVEEKLKHRINAGCKNVVYKGVVEAYDVFSYIYKADIGIITFLEAPNHVETLATKPFEYMACGKPMIMSNFKYWKDTFKESSYYVDPNSVDDIRTTIIDLISNKENMKNMSEQNLYLSKNEYNWEKESQKLLELYKKIII